MTTASADSYLAEAQKRLDEVRQTQTEAIQQGAQVMADAISADGLIHIFGAGHSHMLAEEAFFRAGGLAPVNAILDPSLMLHAGALKSSFLEKVPDYAEALFKYHRIEAHDAMIVVSNSGVNAVPIEMALQARDHNVSTIGVTSRQYSEQLTPKNPANKRLYEVADIVIDNAGSYGDAVMDVPGLEQRVAPMSTITGAAVLNALISETVDLLQERDLAPPIFVSSHIPNAVDHNLNLIEHYRHRIDSI